MITTHTQLLNALIEKYNLKSYLELGVQSVSQNFDKINCDFRYGVDPDVIHPRVFTGTSDQYFEQKDNFQAGLLFGLCFIDGDHTKEQAKKDFENCLKHLAPGGFILIHDVLPENEAGTAVPRATKQWWGDVYKWAMNICLYNGIGYKTFNIDNGCMLVWKDNTAIGNNKIDDLHNNYDRYLRFGRELMNVTDTIEI